MAGETIKRRTLRHLDRYLEELEASVIRAGGIVHWARDAADATAIVTRLVVAEGVDEIVKVKSMATDEIGLNEALTRAGVRATETDLAELIVQLAGESPSHIVVPAIHKNRTEIRDLFRVAFARPELSDEPTELAEAARQHLRERFLRAEVAVSGANFGVAETGTISVVESEGNGRMCTTLPRVLITVMGIEKVLPRFEDLEVFLQLLPRSATGERMNPYTSLWTGVRAGDGPEVFHLVLLDNGRTRVLADPVGRQALACIRCGACLNVCPVYGRTGGHAYRSVYPGPIGAILTPQLEGIEKRSTLPFASTLCGACFDACPVRIDIPEVLLHLRAKAIEAGSRERAEAASLRLVGWIFESPRRLAAAEALGLPIGRMLQRVGLLGRLPGPLAAWSRRRELPRLPTALVPGAPARPVSARDEVLARIRQALADVPDAERPEDVAVERTYTRTLGLAPDEIVGRFVERLADYGTDVRRAASGDEATTIAAALTLHDAHRIGIPADLPPALRPAGVELVEDTGLPTRGRDGLEGLDGVVTTCSVAIAETGTICLAGGRRRRSPGADARARPARVRRAGRARGRQRARGDRGARRGGARGTADHARVRAVGDERHRDEPRRGGARPAAPRRRARPLDPVAHALFDHQLAHAQAADLELPDHELLDRGLADRQPADRERADRERPDRSGTHRCGADRTLRTRHCTHRAPFRRISEAYAWVC